MEEHIKTHDAYNKKVIQISVDEGIDCKLEKINQFLSEWWMNHILFVDMKYKPAPSSLKSQ